MYDKGGVQYNSPDWPITPNTNYISPDGTEFETSNVNGVFLGTNSTLQYPDGDPATAGTRLWVGIQEQTLDALPPTQITGWATADLNPGDAVPTQDGVQYAQFSTPPRNCTNWTQTAGRGALGAQLSPINFNVGSGAFNALSGNYFAWTNGTGDTTFASNLWSASASNPCTRQHNVACVATPK